MYCVPPRNNKVFNGSFLEAPQVLLFQASAIHCYYDTDIEDASFFVELARRKYSRERVCGQSLVSLVFSLVDSLAVLVN